ncbi:MAG: glycerophosphodiester phosphodiesterase family protein [Pyrinomonadaceae bacterium]
MNKLALILLLTLLLAAITVAQAKFVSIEGHRGARGHLPENTIASFIKAVELGADTLELDVVISKDKKVVVSHEPWFSYFISTAPNGDRITRENEKEHNLFLMDYAEIKKYDVGIRGNPQFPDQQPQRAYKPLLSEVFIALDKFTKSKKLPLVKYNIEVKSSPDGDGVYHPSPPEFASLVMAEVIKYKMATRSKLQSFDVRPLQEVRKRWPRMKIALLVGNMDGIEKSIERLGFDPDTYSPHFSLVDQATVDLCRERKIKLVPWTVNEIADLEKMRRFPIDGIITDFPDRAVKVFRGQ